MCQHKWNFRERLVDVVYTRYTSILETLEVITDNGRSEEKSEAEGLLKKCLNPTFICSRCIFRYILPDNSSLFALYNKFSQRTHNCAGKEKKRRIFYKDEVGYTNFCY